jgi:hypothetical protein
MVGDGGQQQPDQRWSYALQTMCEAAGLANATILEAL